MSTQALNRLGSNQAFSNLRSDARAFVARSLTKVSDKLGPAAITVSAPIARPEALIAPNRTEATLLWQPPQGPAYAGLGEGFEVSPDSCAVKQFFGALHRVVDPRLSDVAPRLFGGMAFDGARSIEAPWRGFGRGSMTMPRWLYAVEGKRAWLTHAVSCDALSAKSIEGSLNEFDAIWRALENDEQPNLALAEPVHVEAMSSDAWDERVQTLIDAIQGGGCDKVVTARRTVVEFGEAVDALCVASRLRARFLGCTSFALWRGDATLLGASPELLVSRSGRRVVSEAMAGSVENGRAQALLDSPKERAEHQLVVDAIVAGLGQYCERVQASAQPTIRELPNVLHMQTPISGVLAADTHIIDLVRALHPTPAVGGVPSKVAMQWIAALEDTRGWYGAPFGWVDDRGDGEFVVALRSGVVQGNRVYVYAGAGIMGDSDPAAEYAETELKMRALLGALNA